MKRELSCPGGAGRCGIVDRANLRLSWPASAPATVKLQKSTSLLTGSWADDITSATVVGSEKVVVEPLDGPIRFFRLVQP